MTAWNGDWNENVAEPTGMPKLQINTIIILMNAAHGNGKIGNHVLQYFFFLTAMCDGKKGGRKWNGVNCFRTYWKYEKRQST